MMDAKGLNDILERVDQHVEAAKEAIDEAMKGKPLDAETLTDEEHARLFEEKAAKNPNWVLALVYVEGGTEELARYERTRGLRGM